jgi:hypothetical protein
MERTFGELRPSAAIVGASHPILPTISNNAMLAFWRLLMLLCFVESGLLAGTAEQCCTKRNDSLLLFGLWHPASPAHQLTLRIWKEMFA